MRYNYGFLLLAVVWHRDLFRLELPFKLHSFIRLQI